MSVSIVSVLSKGLKMSIKLRDCIREVELVDEVEWQDVFFVVLQGIIDGRGRRQG